MATGLVKGNTVVAINPQATAATGTVQVINNTFDGGEELIVNGVTFTEGVDFSAGGTIDLTAGIIADMINDSDNKLLNGVVTAVAVTDTVTISALVPGPTGNSLTLTESNVGVTDNLTLVDFATLATGALDEDTATTPSAGADFIQVLSDGLEVAPVKDPVERNILTARIGQVQQRVSTQSGTGALPVEFKGSGVEGNFPEFDTALLSMFGAKRQLRNRITTGTGHSTTSLNVTNASDIFTIGDFIVILESGAHHKCFVTEVNAGDITYSPAASGAPSDSAVLAKSCTYYPANSNHIPFTDNVYWADEQLEQLIGCRVASMSVDNFTTGALAVLNFSLDANSFDNSNASAAYTPSYDDELPPILLDVTFNQDATALEMNEFGLSFENTIAAQNSFTTTTGRVASRVNKRVITGSFAPYLDDTSTTNFDNFANNTAFDLIITGANPSDVTGELDLGSCFGIYVKNCTITERPIADQDGILTMNISFTASTGTDGSEDEMFLGFC